MSKNKGKWWLALVVICSLAPATFANRDRYRDRGCDPRRDRHCQQVPEGGSTAAYLVGAGVACFGAMFLRSRMAKAKQS